MPLYDYRCESCGDKEEKLERFDAPTEHDCASCGTAQAMRRQVSLTSFTLAGGGWMAQGYANGAGKEKATSSTSITPPAKAESPAAPACAGGCGCHSAKPSKAAD